MIVYILIRFLHSIIEQIKRFIESVKDLPEIYTEFDSTL